MIEQRLATRTTNPYGKRPAERAEALRHLDEVEPLLRARATREIVTTMALEQVVTALLAAVDGVAAPP